MKKTHDLAATENVVPLSEAMDGIQKRRSPYRHVTRPHPQQIKKFLRSNFKRSIERMKEGAIEKVNDTIEDKTLKWKENMIMYDEEKRFRHVAFRKEETERLVLFEQGRPQNALPLEYL